MIKIINSHFWKEKSRATKFSQFLIITVTWQNVIVEEKMVGLYVSDG